MVIRVAREADAPALARVIVETGRVAHRGMVPDEVLLKSSFADACVDSERNWRRTLREIAAETDPQQQIFVAEDDMGMVVGLAMGGPRRTGASPQTGEVYVLYVLQSHQGCGFGHGLVKVVGAHLAKHGMTTLHIRCLAANSPARRFYEAIGGRVVEEGFFDDDGVLLPEVIYGWTLIPDIVPSAGPE